MHITSYNTVSLLGLNTGRFIHLKTTQCLNSLHAMSFNKTILKISVPAAGVSLVIIIAAVMTTTFQVFSTERGYH
jgi:hypothetical protein